jgi:hypothetical protein
MDSAYKTNLQFPATEPTLNDLLDLRKKDVFLSLFCHAIAVVTKFDPTTQTASATMTYQKTFTSRQADGTYVAVQRDYPSLIGCPVIFLGGANSYLTFPDVVGAECFVLFNDRDIENWVTNNGAVLASSRLHSFSDAILIAGLRSNKNAIANFDTNRILLKKGNAKVGIGMSNELVLVGNELYTLNQLLQQLISAIQLITVTGSFGTSSVPVNAATFATIAGKLSQLLE